VASIRRTRLHPRRTDHLYLHLRRLRDDLVTAIGALTVRDVLDVYCGARPYEPLFASDVRYVGLDFDDAYGCADVVSDEFLPFPDESFDLCLCTQAFYFVAEPAGAVAELARVLRPGGHALVTLPVVYPGTERLYTPLQLRELFAAWEAVSVVANGGTAVSIATLSGYYAHQVEKRLPPGFAPVFAAVYVAVNAAGEATDAFERRFLASADALPANLLVKATRP
jgi:SAM-dependent methyltransferase